MAQSYGVRLLLGICLAVMLVQADAVWAQGADEDNARIGFSKPAPVDLTAITRTPDEVSSDEDVSVDDSLSQTGAGIVSSGLTSTSPSSVRLASLGIDLDAVDGLDRLMWGESTVDVVMAIYELLPRNIASPILDQRTSHILLSRAVPPEGSITTAENIVEHRLNWLKDNVEGSDLAILVRQLPDTERWREWKTWLVLHDLINRNDDEACAYGIAQAGTTLDALWHQIKAFCQVIGGNESEASFALDILEDTGLEDATYFALMAKLIDTTDTSSLPEDAIFTPLNLVLMDSAKVEITSVALSQADSHRTSLSGLRYLADDAAILQSARAFEAIDISVTDLAAIWAVLPESGVPLSEALARLALANEYGSKDVSSSDVSSSDVSRSDERALARFFTWQAIALEPDQAVASREALQALAHDYKHGGRRSLELWLSFIIPSDETLLLHGLLSPELPLDARQRLDGEALAWSQILDFSAQPVTADTIITAGAFDGVDMLEAIGVSLESVSWSDHLSDGRALATSVAPLSLSRLRALENSAMKGNRAETLLLAALTLGEIPPWQLGRDDARRLTVALVRAGMQDTARALAREILTGWSMHRFFTASGEGDNATSG